MNILKLKNKKISFFEIIKLFRMGGYCTVYKGIYNGAIVAKKVFDTHSSEYQKKSYLNNKSCRNKDNRNLYMREIEIWNKIKGHPFILQFYGASHISKHPFIISEFCSKGTVKRYLEKNIISTNQKLQIMHDIAIGIYHLHKCKIIHGDIKSDNVLISDNGTPKICDFGLSVYLSNDPKDELISICEITDSTPWKAPELFNEYNINKLNANSINKFRIIKGKISEYSDIFSLGRLYYEIIAQDNPFHEIMYKPEVEKKVVNGDYPNRVYPKNGVNNDILYSDKMWNEILVRTWEYDPFSRIKLLSIASILNQMKTQEPNVR